MILWIGMLVIGFLPEILCLLFFILAIWPPVKRTSVIVFIVVLLMYLVIRVGDRAYSLKHMNDLCLKDDVIEIFQNVPLPKSYWNEDGVPLFFGANNRFVEVVEGVKYKVVSSSSNVNAFGVREITYKFVNTETTKVYGASKNYTYSGTWYERMTIGATSTQSTCYWNTVARRKYGRDVPRYSARIESWIFVPNNNGGE